MPHFTGLWDREADIFTGSACFYLFTTWCPSCLGKVLFVSQKRESKLSKAHIAQNFAQLVTAEDGSRRSRGHCAKADIWKNCKMRNQCSPQDFMKIWWFSLWLLRQLWGHGTWRINLNEKKKCYFFKQYDTLVIYWTWEINYGQHIQLSTALN